MLVQIALILRGDRPVDLQGDSLEGAVDGVLDPDVGGHEHLRNKRAVVLIGSEGDVGHAASAINESWHELEGDILYKISVGVDIDLVKVLVAERIVVGSGAGTLTTLYVLDESDEVGSTGFVGDESVVVRVIGLGHLRCSRCFRVA